MRHLFKSVQAFLFLCLFLFGTQTFAADEPQAQASERTIEVSAGKVVFNVNATGAGELGKGLDGKPQPDASAATSLLVKDPLADVDGIADKLKGKLDVLASWDGFKPWKIVYFLSGLLISIIVSRAVRWLIENYLHMRLARKTPSDLDDLFCKAAGRPASMLVFTTGLFLSSLPILGAMPENIQILCNRIFLAFGAGTVAWAAYRFVEVLDHLLLKIAARTDNSLDDLIVGIIRKIVKVCIVFVSVLFIGQNILGLNITTLLAGAGVAGLAIAFAAQDTIANFFGSLMIIIDQPFTVGDYVKIDAFEGSVERVGLRSTSLRTPAGNLITIPNKTAANSSVENISRRPYIRRVVNFGLVYDTSPEKMELAISILEEIFKDHEGMRPELPPKVHFTEFKDCSLNIQVITWYHPSDFFKHLDWWSKMNLEALRRFNAAGLEFAFPTSTSYLAGDAKRKLVVQTEP